MAEQHRYHLELERHLQSLLPSARLQRRSIGLSDIQLWLIDPEGMDSALSEAETSAIFADPPYWSFCWGSGLAFADRLYAGFDQLKGKTVLDFGCGSGVVAIAAALAGARRVIACDIDPLALKATALNVNENFGSGVNKTELTLEYLDDVLKLEGRVDILFAADVLYDPENRPLVQYFRKIADAVVVADSRVKDFSEQGFTLCEQVRAVTEPDLGELESVKHIRFYKSQCS